MAGIKDRIKNSLLALQNDVLDRDSKNISRERQRKALMRTVEFVDKNLPLVKAYPSRYAMYEEISIGLQKKNGLICEFGVADGKSINFLAKLFSEHPLYGFDSFEGLPEDWREGHPKGLFRVDKLPTVLPNVKLVKGLFQDSLPSFLGEHLDAALFLHIDCDLYSSTRAVLRLFNDRICSGTVLAFDEFFNYPGWEEGEFKAFMEFAHDRGLKYHYLGYNRLGTQLALEVE